ncbi:hypothetical protein HPB52_007749 [Rhipicephalus sanguineus]|uniref:Uncharacterized protein n=1 Tax=Rhipicephalus sanguineus TaxID=34632 RepID=A0A9D4SSR0_RHISA|nr:hypothetical protein HPB52_007749 [Rhipicephalus sanguineus]
MLHHTIRFKRSLLPVSSDSVGRKFIPITANAFRTLQGLGSSFDDVKTSNALFATPADQPPESPNVAAPNWSAGPNPPKTSALFAAVIKKYAAHNFNTEAVTIKAQPRFKSAEEQQMPVIVDDPITGKNVARSVKDVDTIRDAFSQAAKRLDDGNYDEVLSQGYYEQQEFFEAVRHYFVTVCDYMRHKFPLTDPALLNAEVVQLKTLDTMSFRKRCYLSNRGVENGSGRRTGGRINDFTVIRGAPVKVLKFQLEGLDVDITVGAVHALHATRLLRLYTCTTEKFGVLCSAIKTWAARAGIKGAANGGISSYALELMTVAALQAMRREDDEDD